MKARFNDVVYKEYILKEENQFKSKRIEKKHHKYTKHRKSNLAILILEKKVDLKRITRRIFHNDKNVIISRRQKYSKYIHA